MSDSLLQLTPPQIPDPVREIVALGNIPEQTVTPDAPVLVVAPAEVEMSRVTYFGLPYFYFASCLPDHVINRLEVEVVLGALPHGPLHGVLSHSPVEVIPGKGTVGIIPTLLPALADLVRNQSSS